MCTNRRITNTTAHVTRVAPPEPHHDRCPTPLNEHTRPCSGSHCSVYGNARCVFRLDDILPSHVRSETCSSTSTIYNLIRASCDHTRTHLYTTTYVTRRQYRRINRIQKVVISFCVCMKGWELTRARANVNHSPPLPASHLLRHPSSVSYHSSRPNPPPASSLSSAPPPFSTALRRAQPPRPPPALAADCWQDRTPGLPHATRMPYH